MGSINKDYNFFFIKKFSWNISFVGRYLQKTDFFTCGKRSKSDIWGRKIRFFGVHVAYRPNILDSGQITYLSPFLTYRSLISVESIDLQKIKNQRFLSYFKVFFTRKSSRKNWKSDFCRFFAENRCLLYRKLIQNNLRYKRQRFSAKNRQKSDF